MNYEIIKFDMLTYQMKVNSLVICFGAKVKKIIIMIKIVWILLLDLGFAHRQDMAGYVLVG